MLGESRVQNSNTLRLDREHATTWFGGGTSLTCQVDDLRWTTRQGYVPYKSKQINGEGCRKDDDDDDDDDDADDYTADDGDDEDDSHDGCTVVGIHYHHADHRSPTLSVH